MHYFIDDETFELLTISGNVLGKYYQLQSAKGLFSYRHFDEQSVVLIETFIQQSSNHTRILDLACGYGLIGYCVKKYVDCSVDFCDINAKAVNVTKMNVEDSNVFLSDGFSDVSEKYSHILLNPPFHAGKDVCYKMYLDSIKFLDNNGQLWIVIDKMHGAKSTLRYLESIFTNVSVLYLKKHVYVICASNT